MQTLKQIGVIFVSAFLLNLVWENVHVFLYDNYKGGAITELILLHATLVDALIIVALSLPLIFISSLKKQSWTIVILGIIIAIIIEWWALGTARWVYNAYMPIIPFLGTGLTPTIQLGLLGYLSFKIGERKYAQ